MFVGRQDELAQLRASLSAARRSSSGVVLIQGAPGIGKTALLREFLRAHQGFEVAFASGDEDERDLAFGVVDQLLVQLGGSPVGDRGEETLPDAIQVGAHLLERFSASRARDPLTVVVEDAHWADRPSLQSLTFAVRRLRADRVLTLLTVQESFLDRIPEGLRRLRLDRAPLVLHLSGLDAREVRTLATTRGGARPSLHLAERLREHTAGNPLHVHALLDERSDWPSVDSDQPLPAPRSYSLLVLGRLAAAPPASQDLVVASAILGVRCRLGDAAHLAGLDDPLPALEAAVSAQLLQAPPSPGADITFVHPLVRGAVYHDLGMARRAALHRAAATIVPPGPSRLHHRVAGALGEDAELATELIGRARSDAELGAVDAAAKNMLAASRLSPSSEEREASLLEGVELLLLAGDVAAALGRTSDVEAVNDGARRDYVLGLLAARAGRWLEAKHRLTRAWYGGGPNGETSLRPRIAGELALLACLECRGKEAAAWARRSVPPAFDPYPPARLLDLAVGLGLTGAAEEGLARLEALPREAGDLSPSELEGLVGRGMLELWTDDLDRARNDLALAARTARDRGPSHLWMLALGQLAEVDHRAGDWDAAVTRAQLAVTAAEDAGQTWLLPYLHAVAASPLAGRGQWEPAAAHVRAAAEAADQVAATSATCCAAAAAAWLQLMRGHPQGVVEVLEPLRSLPDEAVHEPGTLAWVEMDVEALLSLGQVEEAEDRLDDFERRARNGKRRSAMVDAARLRGLLHAAQGRPELAEDAFRRGLTEAAEIPFPFHRARLELALGAHLNGLGRGREATEQLEHAHETFGRLQAEPLLRSCERELQSCGTGPARRLALRGTALTPQELAVVTLVCQGLTNREVAAELVLSTKTIEFHLGNVFAKLGVTSRTQLCARLPGVGPTSMQRSSRGNHDL